MKGSVLLNMSFHIPPISFTFFLFALGMTWMAEVFFVLIASTLYGFNQIIWSMQPSFVWMESLFLPRYINCTHKCIISQHKAVIDLPALTILTDFCCIASLKFQVLHSTREHYRLREVRIHRLGSYILLKHNLLVWNPRES